MENIDNIEALVFASLQHQLKNDLYNCKNAVRLLGSKAKAGTLSRDEIAILANDIFQSVQRMENSLELSRFSRGIDRNQMNLRLFEAKELVRLGEQASQILIGNGRTEVVIRKVNIGNFQMGFLIDAIALKVVLVNLLQNACDFSLKGKKVQLQCESSSTEFTYTIKNEAQRNDQSELQKWNEPGFSTKGTGTGYGLAVVKNICEQLGLTLNTVVKEQGSDLQDVTVSITMKGNVSEEHFANR